MPSVLEVTIVVSCTRKANQGEPVMNVKIPALIYQRSGKSADNINNTLNWILGYFSSKYKPQEFLSLLDIKNTATTEISIEEALIEQIKIKMNPKDYSRTVSILLVFAYSIGGME
jgi:hypothetical protein